MASGAPQQDEKVQHNSETKMTIHQREDSASELEALFDIGLGNGGKRALSVPMKMRNLPPSFFTPPTVGSKSPSVHSRENSLDNSGPFSPGPVASPHPQTLGQPHGPSPGQGHHSRANSCPATLGQTIAVAQQHQVSLLLLLLLLNFPFLILPLSLMLKCVAPCQAWLFIQLRSINIYS